LLQNLGTTVVVVVFYLRAGINEIFDRSFVLAAHAHQVSMRSV
jgi:hypothetical protein